MTIPNIPLTSEGEFVVSETEISIFRNPSEYIHWFESCLETTGRDRGSRADALQHKGIFKVIYEELFPLYSLLKHKEREWSDSRFRNVLGNQCYDVEIENHRMPYIEIGTTAFDRVELIRMRQFLDEGYVNAVGRPEKVHRNRPIRIRDEARFHEDMLRERIDSISALIETKSAKDYPEGTGLLVYHDDFSILLDEGDNRSLRLAVDGLKAKWKCTFQSVYLVGPRDDILIEATR